jgi:DNA-binding beta-propeller fold protein YncE
VSSVAKYLLKAMAACAVVAVPATGLRAEVRLEQLWVHNAGGSARAEIVAYDPISQQLLVGNGDERCVMRIDVRSGRELGRFDVSAYGDPTSVATNGELAAVSVVAPRKTDPGHVVLFRSVSTPSGAAVRNLGGPGAYVPVAVVRVGALPDMVTFSPDGRYVLVANEGEPSDDYTIDPPGSIGIIDVGRGAEQAVAMTADFAAFNASWRMLVHDGVRLVGPSGATSDGLATVAQDLEPEYISVAPDGRTAWVTLQENNAVAEVDIASARVTRINGLGLKDHRQPGAGLDASDRDGGIHIRPWPVWGMYQPDGIAAYNFGGQTLLFTANEGDVRGYAGFSDEARIAELALDPPLVGSSPSLQAEDRLGRLKVSRVGGDTDGDGDIDRLLAFGGRSMAIWTTDGRLVYDSGDALEQFIAAHMPERFNVDEDVKEKVDNRSPVRGPEPEGVVVGRVGGSIYAFAGLERTSAIAVFDVTRPQSTRLVDVVPLDGGSRPGRVAAGVRNIAPEGLAFIPAERSPWGEPLLAVACEVSGTTVLFRIHATP